MDIAPIKTRRDYSRAIIAGPDGRQAEYTRRRSPGPACHIGRGLGAKHFPLGLPDAVEAIKYHMDQKGLVARDLIPIIGSRNRVYEVLARKRPLTFAMVRRLHEKLGIPAESLIKEAKGRA